MGISARSLCTLAVLVACLVPLQAGTPGTFRGTIVDAGSAASGKRWIYVQARSGTARRVDISHVRVTYDEQVPAGDRRNNPAEALVPGAEVRVTAEQGEDGEWRASMVEVLGAAVKNKQL